MSLSPFLRTLNTLPIKIHKKEINAGNKEKYIFDARVC